MRTLIVDEILLFMCGIYVLELAQPGGLVRCRHYHLNSTQH